MGPGGPLELTARLHDAGAPLVALRCGADGAFVHAADGPAWSLPPVPGTNVVDVTGTPKDNACFLAADSGIEPLVHVRDGPAWSVPARAQRQHRCLNVLMSTCTSTLSIHSPASAGLAWPTGAAVVDVTDVI